MTQAIDYHCTESFFEPYTEFSHPWNLILMMCHSLLWDINSKVTMVRKSNLRCNHTVFYHCYVSPHLSGIKCSNNPATQTPFYTIVMVMFHWWSTTTNPYHITFFSKLISRNNIHSIRNVILYFPLVINFFSVQQSPDKK